MLSELVGKRVLVVFKGDINGHTTGILLKAKDSMIKIKEDEDGIESVYLLHTVWKIKEWENK